MFIDAHCHLTGDEYDEIGGVKAVLERAQNQGVKTLICSGFDLPSSVIAKDLAERFDGVYFSAGIHPSELDKAGENDLALLRELCAHEKCVAVGEIGLDYHFDDNPAREKQKEYFQKQMEIACDVRLPIVVHSRDACADTLELLEKNKHLLALGGLMHCYSYSPESAKEFEKLGFYFSFGGTVTFKNAKKVKESAVAVGKDRILTETDCPYLSPEPLRGKFPNLPGNVPHIARYLSELLGETQETFNQTVLQNATKLFFKLRKD